MIWTGNFSGTTNVGGSALTSAGQYDIFAARYDTQGNNLFSAGYGDAAQQYLSTVTTTPSGEVVMFGSYYGTINVGSGTFTNADPTTEDLFVVKLY